MGRHLLNEEKRNSILATPDPWMAVNISNHQENEADLWWEYMVYENNIDEEKKETEQLVIQDQVIYTCPGCDFSFAWL
jgi:hypothetical protein